MLPQKNFYSYSVEQQEKMTSLAFCVVGLGDQAEACLKVWEVMLYPGQTSGLSEL